MILPLLFIDGLLIFLFAVLSHEYIHLAVLRLLGYNGKLVIAKHKMFFLSGPGIKSSGLKNNFIHATDLRLVLVAPAIPTVILSMAAGALLVYPPNPFVIMIAEFSGIGACGLDLYNALLLKRRWKVWKTK